MRSIAAFLLIIALGLTACGDNGCEPVKPETEEWQITGYAAANGIAATKHSSGMYYEIVNPGSGPSPTTSSIVTVTYVGKRLDGSIFDQSTTPTSFNNMPLSGLIQGWQIGLPLIKKGGEIRLIVPSSLAYGCTGAGNVISANSVLYFDINLIDVQ
jgi:FKBP-type peptidyl-prolyl cis-trans isomerase FkpA